MADFNFQGWPVDPKDDTKPFNRLLPFRRIRVPNNRFLAPVKPPPQPTPGGFVPQPPKISGDGYSAGARSTKDYDAKFGEEIGKDLAEFIQDFIPVLKIPGALTKALSKFAGQIPLIGQALSKVLDDVGDPVVRLFEFLGSKLDALLFDSFIRSIPAWVPVFDEKFHPDLQVMEIDGLLIRSNERYDSVPFWQWHRWYDWRFAVTPSPFFSEMIGFGNTRRDQDTKELRNIENPDEFVSYYSEGHPSGGGVPTDSIVDCEWDIGALGQPPGTVTPPGKKDSVPVMIPPFFFDPFQNKKNDWGWPMTGMFFWAAGRNVYDCSHATADQGRRTKRPDRKPAGQVLPEAERIRRGVHLNVLHPLLALATARWEAFKFKENPREVPAIQFSFFANNQLGSSGDLGFQERKGPELDPFGRSRKLNEVDYQFVVDLPTADVTTKSEYPIGHTPDFALNTLVLRPRLVVDIDFKPFENAAGMADNLPEKKGDPSERDRHEPSIANGPSPIVNLIVAKPGQAQRQALVTIPLTKLNPSFNSYGVRVSIGFLDPDATQVKKVKKVTVKLVKFQVAGDTHESGDAEWVMNVAVNGRWFQFAFDEQHGFPVKRAGQTLDIEALMGRPMTVELLLAEEDFVLVSVHGMEADAFDDLIMKPPPNRSEPTSVDPVSKVIQVIVNSEKPFLNDRILRLAKEVNVPTGPPDPKKGTVPTEKIQVPFMGKDVEWNEEVDTDNDTKASLTARAMFLRLAAGNHFDANDPLGMIDPLVNDPARKDPKGVKRSQDITDTPNPLVVGEVLKEVGKGVPKKCELSAYETLLVGRLGTLAYKPQSLDYKFFYEVTVEDLPEDGA
jgi:hypothetical protein